MRKQIPLDKKAKFRMGFQTVKAQQFQAKYHIYQPAIYIISIIFKVQYKWTADSNETRAHMITNKKKQLSGQASYVVLNKKIEKKMKMRERPQPLDRLMYAVIFI